MHRAFQQCESYTGWEGRICHFLKPADWRYRGTPCLPLGWVRLGPWREKVATVQRHPWVEQALTEIQQKNRCQADEALRGAQLADAWQVLRDPELKAAALADIQSRWREKGWWDQPPPGKSTKKALAIYRGDNA
jgi:hypothetical protein